MSTTRRHTSSASSEKPLRQQIRVGRSVHRLNMVKTRCSRMSDWSIRMSWRCWGLPLYALSKSVSTNMILERSCMLSVSPYHRSENEWDACFICHRTECWWQAAGKEWVRATERLENFGNAAVLYSLCKSASTNEILTQARHGNVSDGNKLDLSMSTTNMKISGTSAVCFENRRHHVNVKNFQLYIQSLWTLCVVHDTFKVPQVPHAFTTHSKFFNAVCHAWNLNTLWFHVAFKILCVMHEMSEILQNPVVALWIPSLSTLSAMHATSKILQNLDHWLHLYNPPTRCVHILQKSWFLTEPWQFFNTSRHAMPSRFKNYSCSQHVLAVLQSVLSYAFKIQEHRVPSWCPHNPPTRCIMRCILNWEHSMSCRCLYSLSTHSLCHLLHLSQ